MRVGNPQHMRNAGHIGGVTYEPTSKGMNAIQQGRSINYLTIGGKVFIWQKVHICTIKSRQV